MTAVRVSLRTSELTYRPAYPNFAAAIGPGNISDVYTWSADCAVNRKISAVRPTLAKRTSGYKYFERSRPFCGRKKTAVSALSRTLD